MPDIYMDVDAAVVVPMNIFPLTDDTDFKSVETGLVYNSAGIVVNWNFVTTAGVMSITAITPTTSGNYDIGEPTADKGMYTIEIPASGGASANNDTEGVGWITGSATGILPWRGPTIGFRAAGINNALIDSAWSATRGLAGTALPDAAADAAGGLIISDAGGLDADDLKADVTAILADTGTDGVLLSSGTGAGQLDFSSGVVKANLAQILGTALTETAGYIAAAFKKFFNVADTNVPTAAAVALEATAQDILTDTGTTLPAQIDSITPVEGDGYAI